MIYSKDINKICALCQNAKQVKGDTSHFKCDIQSCYMPLDGTCDKFVYDIFKKPVHRKRRLKKNYRAEDFSL